MAKRKKPVHYGGGSIYTLPTGSLRAQVYRRGTAHRKVVGSVGEGKEWIDAAVARLDNAMKPLSTWQMRDAASALARLPDGVSLGDAAEFYVRHRAPGQAEVVMRDAVPRFMTDRSAAGLRPATLRQYRHQLTRLLTDMGDRPVDAVRTADLMEWLDKQGLRGGTRATYRASFSALFGWCRRMDWCTSNPASRIARHVRDQRLPEVFRPDVAACVLAAAEDAAPGIVPLFALGMFAGVRAGELERLDWAAINAEHIHIGPAVAKKRRQRYVSIPDNLRAWIRKYRGDGPVVPIGRTAQRRARASVVLAAGLARWPANACRHSFATYHLALHRDAGGTALELGHTSTDLLFSNYRNLATAVEAAAYFSIMPAE
jgi:integrase